jgi:Flp pilus assembly pilin Flp
MRRPWGLGSGPFVFPKPGKNMLRRIFKQYDAQDMVEYGLLVAVVALACVAAIENFSAVINTIWTTVSANLGN